ncbi:MAG: hypothetical protein AAFV88_21435 [Planctomycetota bacterium]
MSKTKLDVITCEGTFDDQEDVRPPWLAFPDVPRFSVGWRTGEPEKHLSDWTNRYLELTRDSAIRAVSLGARFQD